MKTFYKTLTLGVFLAVLAVVSPTFAQGDVCAEIEPNQALYAQYTDNYKGTLEQKETAVKAGNEYIQKYANCPTYSQQVEYLKKAVPKLETSIAEIKKQNAETARIERFNKALQAKNSSEIFAAGDDILKNGPQSLDLDLTIALATIGLDEAAVKKNNTFNGKTIDYAKSVIQKLESGKTSETFGIKGFEYNSKDNTLGWMNYTIGYIEYYHLNKKDEGLSHLYKATQLGPEVKEKDFIYILMGDKYVEKTEALNKEIIVIIETNKGENFESKSKLALSKGYADRAIDAYVKAYDIAKAAAAKETDATKKADKQKYVSNLFETLKGLYKFRYETLDKPMTDAEVSQQLNSYIASASSKTLPSPNSEVKPVDPPSEDEKTDETSTTSTTSTTTTTPAKTASTGANVKTEANKTTAKPKKR